MTAAAVLQLDGSGHLDTSRFAGTTAYSAYDPEHHRIRDAIADRDVGDVRRRRPSTTPAASEPSVNGSDGGL